MEVFITNRLFENNALFHYPIKLNSIKTFVSSEVRKTIRNLWSLATADGMPVSTDKAKIEIYIEYCIEPTPLSQMMML